MAKFIYLIGVISVVTWAILAPQVRGASESEARKVYRAYERLNEFLEKESQGFDSENYDYYLQKAGELLAQEEKNLFRSRIVVYSFKNFHSLGSTVGDDHADKCSHEKFMIIWNNNRAVEGRARERWDYESSGGVKPRPVERTIRHFTLEHAQQCQAEYPKLFHQLLANMNKQFLANVESLWGPLVERRKERQVRAKASRNKATAGEAVGLSKVELRTLLVNIESEPHNDAHLMLAELRRQTKLNNDPNELALDRKFFDKKMKRFTINQRLVDNLMLIYLMPTCLRYVRYMSPVFEPAIYDDKSLDDYLETDDEDTRIFYQHWAYYRLSESFMEHFKGHVQEVMRLAGRDANTLALPIYAEV